MPATYSNLGSSPRSSIRPDPVPLVIDLDGTLIRTDLLAESALRFARRHPLQVPRIALWLMRGKSHVKHQLACRIELNPADLPYEEKVLEQLRIARVEQRKTVLATASSASYARSIAEHLALFDEVHASDGTRNLCSHVKRDVLVEAYGPEGFDYAGNSRADLPIFRAARKSYIVNPDRGVVWRARRNGPVASVIDERRARSRAWIKQLRFHQWAKNALLFVPLVAAHEIGNVERLVDVAFAFLFFGLCASSVYLLNDMLDLEEDRRHPRKRHRPFAAGDLSLFAGAVLAPVLLIAAFGGALFVLPIEFAAALLVYYASTLAYSFVLKRFAMVDVIILAGLYTIRIVAGAHAAMLDLTFWILGFSMFLFLSLAMVKRYAELKVATASARAGDAPTFGRGYSPEDLPLLSSLGASAGYLSVLVMAMYIQEPRTAELYANPSLIWMACPLLLFWISRVWMLAHRGQMHDDPVHFALTDRTSLVIGAMFAAIFWLAS